MLQDRPGITALPVRRPAIVQPVTRIKEIGLTLAVPSKMAPDPDDLLGNILFALKHEGVNLSLLAQVLLQVPAADLEAVLAMTDERFDVRGSELSRLVMMCLSNDGVISKNRRKQFQYVASEEVFNYIEQTARQVLETRNTGVSDGSAEEPPLSD